MSAEQNIRGDIYAGERLAGVAAKRDAVGEWAILDPPPEELRPTTCDLGEQHWPHPGVWDRDVTLLRRQGDGWQVVGTMPRTEARLIVSAGERARHADGLEGHLAELERNPARLATFIAHHYPNHALVRGLHRAGEVRPPRGRERIGRFVPDPEHALTTKRGVYDLTVEPPL